MIDLAPLRAVYCGQAKRSQPTRSRVNAQTPQPPDPPFTPDTPQEPDTIPDPTREPPSPPMQPIGDPPPGPNETPHVLMTVH
ncbi:hypothetical protein [Caballeronia sp.]|uniref:hypothetical protein n=1 Tax=Caballeronia sp. TaxID=1931223 RepID=UPI003C37FB94